MLAGFVARAECAAETRGHPGYPLIHVLGRHDNWGKWAAAQNVADLGSGHAIWADNSVIALQIAGSGYGLALTLGTFVDFFVESKTVVCPFKEALDLEQGYFILRPTNRHSSSAAKAFMDWIPEIE
jgi:DNA-binding transcriptional LysR family regulator